MDDWTKYALADTLLRKRICEIVAEYKIEVIVETGIAFGGSSIEFAKMGPRYIGIDLDPARIVQVRERLSVHDLSGELYQGDSPEVLRTLCQQLPQETLFFLDAHCWPDGASSKWPTPDEILAIRPGQGIIILHDFEVPGKDFGVDHYLVNGQWRKFDYGLIAPALLRWSATHRLEYMKEVDPNACRRGVAFVYPS